MAPWPPLQVGLLDPWSLLAPEQDFYLKCRQMIVRSPRGVKLSGLQFVEWSSLPCYD